MIRKILKHFQRRYWLLGFAEFDEGIVIGEKPLRVNYMKGLPKNKWYADPFILDVTATTIEVLVEEFTYSIGRGRIARLSIDKKTLRLLSERIILDLPTHLSFPAILRVEDKVYIYPENSASGVNTIYLYDFKKGVLTATGVTVSEPLTDAVIFGFQEMFFMAATRIPEDNSNHLIVYKSKGGFKFDFFQDVYFDQRIARNAGNLISIDGKVYRVAQDCSKGYGGGVIFQELINNNEEFVFRTVHEIFPSRNQFALHTFNTHKGVLVIDVLKARYPMIDRIIAFVSQLIH